MHNTPRLTLHDLHQRRARALMHSEKATRAHPSTYRQLKRLIREINTRPLDIAAYYATAVRLAHELKTLKAADGETIFDYFYRNIDPRQRGDARYFRGVCLDLAEQLECLDRWRVKSRRLTVIK